MITHVDSGRRIASLPVAAGGRLELSYVHSIYGQPAVEEFEVRRDGLRLVRLRSASAPVLEYYARPERIGRSPEGGYEIVVSGETPAALRLLASRTGERTVSYAGHVISLHQAAGDGARVSLEVRNVPSISQWISRP